MTTALLAVVVVVIDASSRSVHASTSFMAPARGHELQQSIEFWDRYLIRLSRQVDLHLLSSFFEALLIVYLC